MIGSWRWNFTLGLIGGLITFLLSVFDNILTTTLLNSLYCFLITFALVYAFRWILGTIAGLRQFATANEQEISPEPGAEAGKGTNIDLRTPDDGDSLNELLKRQPDVEQNEETAFSPINPPSLVSPKKLDPEKMAEAVRRMSDGEGW